MLSMIIIIKLVKYLCKNLYVITTLLLSFTNRIWKCILDCQDAVFCTNKCGRKYKSKKALYAHLKYECGVDPQFQCQVCQKSYKHKCSFKFHMIRDHGIIMT